MCIFFLQWIFERLWKIQTQTLHYKKQINSHAIDIYMYKKGKKYYEQNSGQIVIYSLLALIGYISQISIQVYILICHAYTIYIY